MSMSSTVSKDRTTLPLLAFVLFLLFLSHTAASSYAVDDGGGHLPLALPHDLLPLSIASSFLSSLFPLADIDSLPSPALSPSCPPLPAVDPLLYLIPCNLTFTSPPPSPPSPASLLSTLLTVTDADVLLSSLCTLVTLTLLFITLLHTPHQRYMLPGSRPTLPLPVALTMPVRLGHRVGSKRGRKLSAVEEEADSSGEEDVEGEEEDRAMNGGRESAVDWVRRRQLAEVRRRDGGIG